MENFEDLSNEQIRLKLLEYGLPNFPVTTTSRKVLIKKLKNHVETVNNKVRRDTIHVAKYSSDEDVDNGREEPKKTQKKEANRRATIGGSAAKLSKTLPVMPQLPPPKPPAAEKVDASQKRRSGRLTPVQGKDDAGPVTIVPKEPMIIEDSDEEDNIPLTQVRTRDRKSKSKSPSLSRGEMVTTSYTQEKVIKPTILEEMEVDLTESTDDLPAAVEPPPPEPEPMIRPQVTPSRESRFTSTTTSSITSSKRTTLAGPPPASSGLSHNRPAPDLSSSFGRPSISSNYAYQSPQPAKRDEIKLGPTDSPYLSEFTKRLSRLKAESVGMSGARTDQPVRRTIGTTSYTAAASPGGGDYVQSRLAAARGGIRQREPAANDGGKGEIRASLRQVILALDQKYSFKKLFYTLIIILIVVFLFVFFFM